MQVPANATIAGFGNGSVVYLSIREKGKIRLPRVRVN